MGGAFGPRPCFGFAGPSGPQNAAAPPRTLAATSSPRASPPPPALRRLLMGSRKAGAATRGGGGVWRPGGGPRAAPRPAKQKSGVRGQGPRAPLFQDASRPAAAPPPPGFPPTPKRQRKARPFVQPSPAPSTTRKKVVATASRCEGACNRAGEPSVPFSGEEPRRNERSPGKGTLPGPSGWSPRRRGQRRNKPPAAGCYPRTTAPASARRSPPA